MISVVLLIALTLFSAAIIFNFTNRMIENQGEDIEKDLLKYSANIESFESVGELGTAGSSNEESNPEIPTTKIIIKRMDDGGDILGLKFIFTDNQGNGYSYESDEPLNDVGLSQMYEINVDYVQNVDDFKNIKKVSVSFIYAKDKTSKVLDEEFLDV